eukprot:6026538-Prymnesium_polylepis.2
MRKCHSVGRRPPPAMISWPYVLPYVPMVLCGRVTSCSRKRLGCRWFNVGDSDEIRTRYTPRTRAPRRNYGFNS